MDGFVMSAATGALKPVLTKLASMVSNEYNHFKGARSKIEFLTKELTSMHAFLLRMSEEENPDVQDKIWMEEVREISYDIEDSLDKFIYGVDGSYSNSNGFIDKCKSLLAKIKNHHGIARMFDDLKAQVKEVGDRNARYKIPKTITTTSNVTVDHRSLAIFEDASKIVGLDEQKYELIKLLTSEDECVSSQQPKVVSIVGYGGIGKTTLAYQVYEELKKQFECRAFVSASRTPDTTKIFRTIMSEVSNKPYSDTEAGDIQQLVRGINNFLKGKRYLIVIDDVWKTETCDVIKYALFRTGKNSRIITTTRIHDVAKACCASDSDRIYKIRPLGHPDSEILFFKRIFGSQDQCPEHLTEVSNMILEKCDGLPLSIISISGLLANKPQTREHWEQVYNSIGCGIGKNPNVQIMMQILSLSYFDLQYHLKTCLLYLSVFPEDSVINKSRLIRRWIAEGFIQEEKGHTLYELGERCFNELINRSLIQARYINIYGEVRACQIHDMILDFISSKSEEENFVTVLNKGYQMLRPHSKIRRLSLHANSQEHVSKLTELNVSHVRSLAAFNYPAELPSLSEFNFLRVLDLQGCMQLKGHHLLYIGNLFQLKYLGLCETGVCELPEQIMKLQCLETLNLKWLDIKELPSSFINLRRLVHFVVDEGVKLPDGIGNMTAVEDMEYVSVFKQSIDFTRQLGQLINLRRLCLYLHSYHLRDFITGESRNEYMYNIVSSLSQLDHLHSLSIDTHPDGAEELSLDSGGRGPHALQKLEIMGGFISKVPDWVGSLINLQMLTLHTQEFEVEDIMVLGRLPTLVFVQLVAPESFEGRRVTIKGADGFQCLKHFDFRCAIPVTFEVGAMPKLEKLTLMFSALETTILLSSNVDFPFGIEHLSSLVTIDCMAHLNRTAMKAWFVDKSTQIVDMNRVVADTMDVVEAAALDPMTSMESAIESSVRSHPKYPRLNLRRTTVWKAESSTMYISCHERSCKFPTRISCSCSNDGQRI
ncbi:unnamed protein product [Urochloa decumbens]|uniref:Uncharacterized protein n=1 Tax=Urochloa decumbens TaxID=240449 RepID=A0ABC9F2Q0_9POAL